GSSSCCKGEGRAAGSDQVAPASPLPLAQGDLPMDLLDDVPLEQPASPPLSVIASPSGSLPSGMPLGPVTAPQAAAMMPPPPNGEPGTGGLFSAGGGHAGGGARAYRAAEAFLGRPAGWPGAAGEVGAGSRDDLRCPGTPLLKRNTYCVRHVQVRHAACWLSTCFPLLRLLLLLLL
ncbi:unnamed protein product, partial [Prorocentrum cordatum]